MEIREIRYDIGCSAAWFHALCKNVAGHFFESPVMEGNVFYLPSSLGEGAWRFIKLDEDEGLALMVGEGNYKTAIALIREATATADYFILHLNVSNVHVECPDNGITGLRNYILYTNSTTTAVYKPALNENIRTVRIIATRKWIQEHITGRNATREDNWMEDFMNSISSCMIEELDDESARLMLEIISNEMPEHLSKLYTQGLVLKIVATCLQRRQRKVPLRTAGKELYAELSVMLLVRDRLISDFENPHPTIAELAGWAGMSKSKFKILFKHIFGKNCYEYFQYARMEKARELLLSGFPVSDTGFRVGYSNLGYFAHVFKRHFGMLPSKFQEMRREEIRNYVLCYGVEHGEKELVIPAQYKQEKETLLTD